MNGGVYSQHSLREPLMLVKLVSKCPNSGKRTDDGALSWLDGSETADMTAAIRGQNSLSRRAQHSSLFLTIPPVLDCRRRRLPPASLITSHHIYLREHRFLRLCWARTVPDSHSLTPHPEPHPARHADPCDDIMSLPGMGGGLPGMPGGGGGNVDPNDPNAVQMVSQALSPTREAGPGRAAC